MWIETPSPIVPLDLRSIPRGRHRDALLRTVVGAVSVVVAAAPMGTVAWRLFGAALPAYAGLLPLAALALFRRPGGPALASDPGADSQCAETAQFRVSSVQALLFVPGTILAAAGLFLGRPSLVWIGSYWNTLAVLHLHGLVFAFPAPLLIFAVSPLASFSSVVVGFSLRLWLSDLSADMLQLLDPAAMARGNVITFRGEDFAVDRLCEGMKMATASFLTAAVLARFASGTGRWIILAAAAPLWLGANLFRILCLVLFHIPAGTLGHEMIGLAFFGGMVLFPLAIVSLAFSPPVIAPRPTARAASCTTARPLRTHVRPPITAMALTITGALCLLSVGALRTGAAPSSWSAASAPSASSAGSASWPTDIHAFRREAASPDPDVAIFHRNEDSLILKRNLFAPGTAHDPRICFEAAGFTMHGEIEESIGPYRVRSAHVMKSGKPARLLWWYAWKGERSSSDVAWRLARLQGNDVLQVNLYGADDGTLREMAVRLLAEPALIEQRR